jgi:hypothetical protein
MIEWIVLALVYSSARQYSREFDASKAAEPDWQLYDASTLVKRDIIKSDEFVSHLNNPNLSWADAWEII